MMADNAQGAIAGAAAVVVATELPEFRELVVEDFTGRMDGRLVLDPAAFLSPSIPNNPALAVISIGRAA